MNMNTLPTIASELGLNPKTLFTVFARYDERGKARPMPVGNYGPNKGVSLYDVDEVKAWYKSRHKNH